MVPAYNEQEVVLEFHEHLSRVLAELQNYSFEILFVDDGSSDATLELIKKLALDDKRVSYLSFTRNFGKEKAMIAGLDAIETDAVVIMDVDLQDPPWLESCVGVQLMWSLVSRPVLCE